MRTSNRETEVAPKVSDSHRPRATSLRQRMMARLAQNIFDQNLAICKTGVLDRVRAKVLGEIRQWLCKSGNPLVTYEVDGTEIRIPLAHPLPSYRAMYPHYSQNTGRIAGYVKAKYPELTFVDVGANIGDSVAIVRSITNCPILCIEGDAGFFSILEMNTSQFEDVYLEQAFVGNLTGTIRASIDSQLGTGHLVLVENGNESPVDEVAIRTLSNILLSYPLFSECRMLKIDTDGFDVAILRSELAFLSQRKPVIFFEYDPHLWDVHTPEGYRIFEELQSVGYMVTMVFENSGDYLCSVELANSTLVEDIHEFCSGRASLRYCDICAFHQDDIDLWHIARQAELEFFRSYRVPPLPATDLRQGQPREATGTEWKL